MADHPSVTRKKTAMADALAPTSIDALLSALSVAMFQPPLAGMRDQVAPGTALATALLVIDYRTEMEMNGLSGFLENETGQRLS